VIEALRDSPDNPPRILVERILDTVARYGEGAGQPADQTVLAVRFAGSEGSLNEGHAAKVALAAA
jgi:serine phosphatase RsbU (regulator of sigma subunit)